MTTQFHCAVSVNTSAIAAHSAWNRFFTLMLLTLVLVLAGCQSTGKSSVAVGPSVGPSNGKALGDKRKQYVYNSDIYLDVAIPTFDPGIPEDFDELKDKSIWPQLRRAEANRFAVNTKKAMEKIPAFGAVSVVPTPQATADLYVLGRINQSDSETVEITIEVADITGRRWDKETFEHTVSEGFFRDKKNADKDSYEPVFDDIAEHVFKLLSKTKEKYKADLKQITNIRYAQSLSPEAFADSLEVDRKGYIKLVQLPAADDPMMARIEPLRVQEQMFIDRLQTQYEGFSAKTDESYHLWQKETLPAVIAAREARNDSILKGIVGGAILAAAVITADGDMSTKSKILTYGAGIAGAFIIKDAIGDSAEAEVHRATIDESGESLDIEMDPQVVKLEDKTVELSGSAQEQFEQWKAHLKRTYELEQTPNDTL